jgi:hypothetical protein
MPGSVTPEQIVRAYQTRLLAIRSTAGNAAARAWTLASVDDASAERFVRQAAAVSTAAQTRTSALVDAYVSAILAEPPKGITAPVGAAVRNGTPTDDVYHRAIVEARTKLSEGQSWADAMHAGRARAISSVETDVMLTQRQAFVDRADGESRIHGYRRVLTGKSCMFCATVSTQRYHTGELMPVHNHCDCTVAPIVGSTDPGRVINADLLATLKASGGSQYWKARGLVDIDEAGRFKVANPDGTARVLEVAERHHGELGPVLVDRSQHFAGTAAVTAA